MPESTNSVRVVAICGSLRAESYTRAGLVAALQGAQELGVDARLIDLNDYNLPLFDASKEDADLPEGVLRLRQDVQQAHGILLGTPEYHAGYSGVLKNALDYMGFAEFEGKMIGLLAVSGGRMGATNALNGLRAIGRALACLGRALRSIHPAGLAPIRQPGRYEGPGISRACQRTRPPGSTLCLPALGRASHGLFAGLGRSAGQPRRRVMGSAN